MKKGKQGSLTLRVPRGPRGQRFGAAAIRSMAWLTSSTNLAAARLLRCRYQRAAASTSSIATGWKEVRRARIIRWRPRFGSVLGLQHDPYAPTGHPIRWK